MPYTHYTIDERNALLAMIGMGLPRNYISVILGKRLGSVYRELNGNSSEGIYTGREAQYEAEDRRRTAKDSPQMNDPIPMREVLELLKKDYSPDQIAERLKSIYAENPKKWVSHETIYRYLYQRMAEEPELKRHF
jgi:IS30 family transposase